MIAIPAIDLRDGRCVRLLQGDFARETVYDGDPLEVALSYRDGGLSHLHLVDLDGARSGRQRHRSLVARIVEGTGMEVQLGGGIRDRDAVARWLDSGVARCVVGSTAVGEPATVAGWLADFGPAAIVLALDVRIAPHRDPRLSLDGWTRAAESTLWQAMDFYAGAGVRHVLCTDVGRDGTMGGPNLDLYADFRARYPQVALQASGGVRGLDDLAALRDLGVAAAITGRALLEAAVTPSEIGSFLRGA